MNHGSRMNMPNRRGFSLVEVLIAVLVLAIGLLGLGAVFPAIIAEQRESFEVIEGENAAGAAASMITSRELVDFRLISEDFNRPDLGGATEARYIYEWIVPQDGQSYYGWDTPMPGFNFVTGLWSYNINDSSVNPTITIVRDNPELGQIPVSARLYPQPYSGKDPRFVWDLALRREPAGDRVQAAIFVRRIDARLKVPRDHSFSDVLTGGGGIRPEDTRLPVGIFNDGGSDPRNGTLAVDEGPMDPVVYAAIQMLEVEVDEDRLDWLLIPDDQPLPLEQVDTSIGFATRVGQKLLDNTGVVRTVVGQPQLSEADLNAVENASSSRIVIVDPPFTASNAPGAVGIEDARPTGDMTDPDLDDERASFVRQVIFTPRTPVAIRVVTLEGTR